MLFYVKHKHFKSTVFVPEVFFSRSRAPDSFLRPERERVRLHECERDRFRPLLLLDRERERRFREQEWEWEWFLRGPRTTVSFGGRAPLDFRSLYRALDGF